MTSALWQHYVESEVANDRWIQFAEKQSKVIPWPSSLLEAKIKRL